MQYRSNSYKARAKKSAKTREHKSSESPKKRPQNSNNTKTPNVRKSLDEAIDFIEPYCTVDFYDESVKTVTEIYNKDIQYNYNNDTIASLLHFTDMDYAQSYCYYNDSQR